MKKTKQPRIVKGVYLEPEVIRVVKEEANKQRRSMSGQLSFIIENWVHLNLYKEKIK